jgi:PHD/YefM family antitoxin component YafN of YafNO toxin-antitoxin module
MSAHRYDAMMETIEILADKTVMAELEKSAVDFKAGRVYPDEKVWRD